MPNLNGHDTIRKIREKYRDPAHPIIIAVSASILQSDKDKCLENGVDKYITKPLNQNILKDILNKIQRS